MLIPDDARYFAILKNHRPAADMRNVVGATQHETALIVDVCQSTVAKTEKAGDGVSVRTLERLCNKLGYQLQLVVRR